MRVTVYKSRRDVTLDFMKTMLVVGMITAHVFQLCYSGGSKLVFVFSTFFNMLTFSSFMFCFGCSAQLAYLGKYENRKYVREKLLKNFIRLLLCFYISGLAYLILVENDISFLDFFAVILLQKIPGYSEFLLSFAMINVVIYIFYNSLRSMSISKYQSLGMILFSLVSTFIPYNFVNNSILGSFVGTEKYNCFPILQYFPFFIIGMYCQSNNKFFDKCLWVGTLLATVLITIYVISTRNLPDRFPPSLFWILWPSMFILLYYFVSNKLGNKIKQSKIRLVVDVFGAYTLDYLVISNLLIFSMQRMYGKNISIGTSFVFAIFILSICFMYGYIRFQIHKKKIITGEH